MHRLKLAVSYSYQNKNFAEGNTKENLQLYDHVCQVLENFCVLLKIATLIVEVCIEILARNYVFPLNRTVMHCNIVRPLVQLENLCLSFRYIYLNKVIFKITNSFCHIHETNQETSCLFFIKSDKKGKVQ